MRRTSVNDIQFENIDEQVGLLLTQHRVSRRTGFLAENPLAWLPMDRTNKERNRYLWRIDEIAYNLPQLIREKKVRRAVDSLIVPSWGLVDFSWGAQNLLMLDVSMITHAFFQETLGYKTVEESLADKSIKYLPQQLADPLWRVSQLTGVAPTASYCLYSLWNYRTRDRGRSINLQNLELIRSFTGSLDERWFVWIHQMVEATFARAIPALLRAYLLSFLEPDGRTIGAMVHCLVGAGDPCEDVVRVLQRMREHCDQKTYFSQVRMFYSFPRRVVFVGVRDLKEEPQEFFGETGGQTPYQHFRLEILGIKHAEDAYFREMRKHMQRYFRKLVELAGGSRVRQFVLDHHAKNRSLAVSYNRLVQAVIDWREFHRGLVEDFIKVFGEVHGTGKPPLTWLDKLTEETRGHLILV